MRISDLQPELSDQLYIWSDNHEPQPAQTDFCCLAPTPSPAIAPAATARGKPRCKCARGPGHGPKYYLSVSHYGQRPQMDYIPQDYYRQTTEYVANYHRLRQRVDEICAINRELLSRREAL